MNLIECHFADADAALERASEAIAGLPHAGHSGAVRALSAMRSRLRDTLEGVVRDALEAERLREFEESLCELPF